MQQVHIRQAVKDDRADIARLFLISSDGLAEYIWSRVAEPGDLRKLLDAIAALTKENRE